MRSLLGLFGDMKDSGKAASGTLPKAQKASVPPSRPLRPRRNPANNKFKQHEHLPTPVEVGLPAIRVQADGGKMKL